jgi:hypothetical protein
MSNPQDRINIQLDISTSNPQVLQGLEELLRLDLISDRQVRELCQEHLTSPLPPLPVTEAVTEPEAEADIIPPTNGDLEAISSTPPTPPPPQKPSYIGQAVRSLMAELSVQWLLFLGVFMVTLSSGVLAATQWEQFPPFGQYLVLFAYTCLFWFVSQWAVKQSNLQLTGQTLQTATMLLVPLNFWAMDGFGLWQSPLGWITVAIAAFVLTGITLNTYKNTKQVARSSPLPWFNYIFVSFLHWGWTLPVFPLMAVYFGTISSSVTTFYQTKYQTKYQTTYQTTYQTKYQTKYLGEPGEEKPREDEERSRGNPPPVPIFKGEANRDRPDRSAYLLVLYATAVLLFRGIFLQGIEISQLGLAIGISGWLFVWLSEKKEPDADEKKTIPPYPQLPLIQIGNVLLFAGWCISFLAIPWASQQWQPWQALQAIGVSGLALWLLFRRFLVGFQRNNLIAIFLIGLQACILLRQIIPPGFRSQAVKTGVELAQAADAPFTIYAITLIPYLILTVWFTDWIYRQDKPNAWNCGITGDYLSLGLAVIMASLSLANVNVRSLNLLATTIILAVITYRRLTTGIGLPDTGDRLDYTFPPETTATSLTLVYLTHIGSLLTVASFIDKFFPNLALEIWGAICLAVMVVEWQLYFGSENLLAKSWAETVNQQSSEPPVNQIKTVSQYLPNWRKIYWAYFIQQSSYYLGLSLAALSYYLFTETQLRYGYEDRIITSIWGVVWLITPIALTDIAKWSTKQRIMASWLSTIALVMANSILLEMPVTRLIGFGVASVLMFINTRYLRQTGAAAIAIGFSLCFTAIVLDFGIFGLPRVSGSGWLIAAALAIAVLVGVHKWLTAEIAKTTQETEKPETTKTHHESLPEFYTPAVKGWAIFLSTFLLIILTLHSLLLYLFAGSIWFSLDPNLNALIATIIVTSAIGYWNFPVFNNRSMYALAWCLEIIAAETLAFFDGDVLMLAVANITLGLTTQLLGDWYYSRRQSTEETIPRSWDIIPLAYAVLGASLRSGTLTSWTGLTTLGLAFTAIGVGRRSPQGKFLIYLAFVGVWASAYEGLYYQISHLGTGDQLVAIAALTTGILYAYRLLTPWLTYYLKLTQDELMIAAHIHWVVGSSVLIAAIAYPISVNMLLGIGTGALLARYAIMQGRHNPYLNIAETWVYLGLLETAALLAYGLTRLPEFWLNWVISWSGAIATLIAYFFYFIPWDKWGWPQQPWRRSAIILPITTAFILGGNLLSSAFVPSSLLMPAGFYIFLAWFHRRSVNAWRFTYLSGVLIDWAIIRWLIQLNVSEPLWYVIPTSLFILYIAQVDPDLKKSEAKESRHILRVLASGTICVVSLLTANWLITGLLSLVAIFAGLILRVRAYLYVGTVVFLLNAIYQMVILIYEDTQLKWAIGLLVGIGFIWIAATFERSRQQIVALVQQAIAELETWE